MAVIIIIGEPAIQRPSRCNDAAHTTMCKQVPANASGKITLVYRHNNSYSKAPHVSFGIWFLVSGTIYQCRSATGDLGADQYLGYNSWAVDLEVQAGDFIAQWITSGYVTAYDSSIVAAYISTPDAVDHNVAGQQANFSGTPTQRIRSFGGSGVAFDPRGKTLADYLVKTGFI